MYVVSITTILFTFTLVQCQDGRGLPTHTINLDLEPEVRWVDVAQQYRMYQLQLRGLISHAVPVEYLELTERLITAFHLENYFPREYARELVGVAKGLNLTVPEVFLMNVFYEASILCTSIVVRHENGTIFHARNLDYSFKSVLNKLNANIEFRKQGKLMFKSTSFVGQVGFFTVMKPNLFTTTINQRYSKDSSIVAILEALFAKRFTSVQLFLRLAAETARSFDEAVTMISDGQLLVSAYFIVGGVKPHEGVVVTRGQNYFKDLYYLNETADGWFLVQTNYDHWMQPPTFDDRRDAAIKHMRSIGPVNFTINQLDVVLSTPPVLNEGTVYTAFMSAAMPGVYYAYDRA